MACCSDPSRAAVAVVAARVAVAETATRGVDVTRAMIVISIGRRRNVLCASMWATRADSDGIFTRHPIFLL
jgi:hypothetical protein